MDGDTVKKSIIYNLNTVLNIVVIMGVFLNSLIFKNLILSKILFITCVCNLVILIIYRTVKVAHDKHSD